MKPTMNPTKPVRCRVRTLAIRYWLAIALAAYYVCAVSPFVFTGAVLCSRERPAPEALTISNMLSSEIDQWTDPAWQRALVAEMPERLSVVLLQGDREIFRAGKQPIDPTAAGRTQIIVMNGTQQVGVANLYDLQPCNGAIYATFATPASIIVQIFMGLIIGWVLTRYVLRPLAAMSTAAQQIANGNLEFDLPPSRVREVANVTSAFHAMGDALRASLTRQSELEQDRRFFISAIAHDLRTPLFALRGYLAGLAQGLATTPEKSAHYIAVCQEKADALERLIADLFAFSRLEYLEQAPQRAPMDFCQLIVKAADDIRPAADTRHVTVSVDSTTTPCQVNADWSLLARALGNLLDNALRYTPDGGTIKISWYKDNDQVRFAVLDSGPGIAPGDLPNLFTPLFRAETSRNRETGGAGLGLTIARRILQAHGGDLTAGNRAEGGAEFTGSFQAG